MNGKILLRLLTIAILLFSTACIQKVPLVVTNGLLDYNIYCIYISRGTDDVWGSNHLPGTDILEPGKEAEVLVRPGVYDIQAVDQDGDTYTLRDIRIAGDGFNWTVTLGNIDDALASSPSNLQHAGQSPLTIKNNLGSWDVHGIWISPSTGSEWGDNHLGDEILYQGDSYTAYVQPDTYDIYLEDEDGDTYTRWDVSVGQNGYSWDVTLDDIDSSGG